MNFISVTATPQKKMLNYLKKLIAVYEIAMYLLKK